ncbi:MAG: hypothetical protein K6V97_09120 [Actinomycetia bacterium]|nr:hypothetical protein [Actinomycetes bacterium]
MKVRGRLGRVLLALAALAGIVGGGVLESRHHVAAGAAMVVAGIGVWVAVTGSRME